MSTYYFNSISVVDIRIDNREQTREVLKQAKQALINYAITNVDGLAGNPGEYGFLPCPDANGAIGVEGDQDPNCGARSVNSLGYFPWRSLGAPVLKDGSGSCLWYAVSGSYKNAPASMLINEDTDGLLQVVDAAGVVSQDDVVAIVFAPGAALDGQARAFDDTTHCGEDYGNASAYLEGDGVTDNATLIGIANSLDQSIHETLTSASEATPYNDNLVTITREDIWPAIMTRADIQTGFEESTEALAQCLAEYVNHGSNSDKRIPWPAPVNINGNDFQIMSNYSDELNAAQGYAGRFPFHIDDSNVSIVTTISDDLIDDAICDDLTLPIAGLVNIDLTDANGVHRRIIENWKDHFFLATSLDYSVSGTGVPSCGDCISIGGTDYAAIIFFGNSPILAQQRTDATKLLVSSYLENNNAADFTDLTGDAVYETAAAMPDSNDIMYCLTNAATPTVVAC